VLSDGKRQGHENELFESAHYNLGMPANDEMQVFCARCSAQLKRGVGEFFAVKIKAFADPTPPEITSEDLRRDFQSEIGRLINQMKGLSERELADQVHRRSTLLCTLISQGFRSIGGSTMRPI
jgi:hypothetical protein